MAKTGLELDAIDISYKHVTNEGGENMGQKEIRGEIRFKNKGGITPHYYYPKYTCEDLQFTYEDNTCRKASFETVNFKTPLQIHIL